MSDVISLSDLPVPAPIKVTTRWELRPRLCPHCQKPVAEHPTQETPDAIWFKHGEWVIHIRRKL